MLLHQVCGIFICDALCFFKHTMIIAHTLLLAIVLGFLRNKFEIQLVKYQLSCFNSFYHEKSWISISLCIYFQDDVTLSSLYMVVGKLAVHIQPLWLVGVAVVLFRFSRLQLWWLHLEILYVLISKLCYVGW